MRVEGQDMAGRVRKICETEGNRKSAVEVRRKKTGMLDCRRIRAFRGSSSSYMGPLDAKTC